MPTLGGGNTLRGYDDYRFRDRNAAFVSAEYRWPVFRMMDAALFADAGSVASTASGLWQERLEHDYGFGFRFHTATRSVARIDVAKGREGSRVSFSLTAVARKLEQQGHSLRSVNENHRHKSQANRSDDRDPLTIEAALPPTARRDRVYRDRRRCRERARRSSIRTTRCCWTSTIKTRLARDLEISTRRQLASGPRRRRPLRPFGR